MDPSRRSPFSGPSAPWSRFHTPSTAPTSGSSPPGAPTGWAPVRVSCARTSAHPSQAPSVARGRSSPTPTAVRSTGAAFTAVGRAGRALALPVRATSGRDGRGPNVAAAGGAASCPNTATRAALRLGPACRREVWDAGASGFSGAAATRPDRRRSAGGGRFGPRPSASPRRPRPDPRRAARAPSATPCLLPARAGTARPAAGSEQEDPGE